MPLPPRLRWKIDRYRRKLEEGVDDFRSRVKLTSTARQRVCPSCRALVAAGESKCPFCREPLSALDRVGVRRLFAGLLPDTAQYTTLLLAANFLMFGITLLAAVKSGVGMDMMLWRMPGRTLVALGARDFHVAYGEWWRLVTAMFLHGGFIHLLMNTWVLFDVAPMVEEVYGKARFLVVYVIAGIAGSFASFVYHPLVIMVGASGALFGLIGLMIAWGYRKRTTIGTEVRSLFVRWAVYGLALGLMMPGIDNAAHFGGLIAGLCFGALVSDRSFRSPREAAAWRLASYAALIVIGLSFLMVAIRYK